MHYQDQRRAVVRQYMIEPIARRNLSELECIDHVIAEINTITAHELGFETFAEMKRIIGTPVNTAEVRGSEHVWHQVERRVR